MPGFKQAQDIQHIGEGGELDTQEEAIVAALDALATTGVGEFMKKTGATTFANASGGGGAGDMAVATYDVAGVSEQLVGLTAVQTLSNKTFNAPGDADAIVSSASTTTAGKIEVATAAETTTGTDATRAVSPDGLAGSDYGIRVVSILPFDDSANVATGDGAGDLFWRVPSVLNSYNLVAVAAQVQTAGVTGTTDVQIRNVTQAADMLSTKITIDSTETDSSTAATPAVIDGANDDVATADQLRIDVDAVSTTPPKGLMVELNFQKP